MPCESCSVQFSVFKRRRACSECGRDYCGGCLRRGGAMCAPCRLLSTRPLYRQSVAHLKVRDLQCFLQRQNVSTRGCVEKDELVTLCVVLVNSSGYRRRGSRSGSFPSLKGFTNNINNFLNNAFDLHPPAATNQQTQSQTTQSNCYNTAHPHAAPSPAARAAPAPSAPHRERFTTTPGGERDIAVAPPEEGPGGGAASPGEGPRVESADCFEIEDLDDWEMVARAAAPLPTDSEELMTAASTSPSSPSAPSPPAASPPPAPPAPPAPPRTPLRASSELELRRSESSNTDTASLHDEPLGDIVNTSIYDSKGEVCLSRVSSASQLHGLSARELKTLLRRHRVEYAGCIERDDLLQRAATLLRDTQMYAQDVESLPLEECCKICMAAPLQCVLLECGHMAACTRCATQLAECPICRQYVVRCVRVFRA